MATNASTSKKSFGRKKVQMVRMEKDSNRRVTFSKRHSGIFKKASELCTLCAIEAAIIIFSPGRKPITFGHPSVETIINRFFPPKTSSSNVEKPSVGAQGTKSVVDLNVDLTLLTEALEMAKKRGNEISKITKFAKQYYYLQDSNFEKLTLEQLIYLESSLQALAKNVMYLENMMMSLFYARMA